MQYKAPRSASTSARQRRRCALQLPPPPDPAQTQRDLDRLRTTTVRPPTILPTAASALVNNARRTNGLIGAANVGASNGEMEVAVSADGHNLVVASNGGSAFSSNGGNSFSTPLQVTNESSIYYYPNGAAVLPNGTAVIVASRYPEKRNATKLTGPVPIVSFTTSNGGASWTRTVVDLNTGASFATSSGQRSHRTPTAHWCCLQRSTTARTARGTFDARQTRCQLEYRDQMTNPPAGGRHIGCGGGQGLRPVRDHLDGQADWCLERVGT
jgi:hypothetical protein